MNLTTWKRLIRRHSYNVDTAESSPHYIQSRVFLACAQTNFKHDSGGLPAWVTTQGPLRQRLSSPGEREWGDFAWFNACDLVVRPGLDLGVAAAPQRASPIPPPDCRLRYWGTTVKCEGRRIEAKFEDLAGNLD